MVRVYVFLHLHFPCLDNQIHTYNMYVIYLYFQVNTVKWTFEITFKSDLKQKTQEQH